MQSQIKIGVVVAIVALGLVAFWKVMHPRKKFSQTVAQSNTSGYAKSFPKVEATSPQQKSVNPVAAQQTEQKNEVKRTPSSQADAPPQVDASTTAQAVGETKAPGMPARKIALAPQFRLSPAQQKTLWDAKIANFPEMLSAFVPYDKQRQQLPPQINRLDGTFEGILIPYNANLKPIRFTAVFTKDDSGNIVIGTVYATFQPVGKPVQNISYSGPLGTLGSDGNSENISVLVHVTDQSYIHLFYDEPNDTWFGNYYAITQDGKTNTFVTHLSRLK